MYRTQQQPPPRKAVILMVVLSLLTLFAIVGLSFVLSADAAARAARIAREGESDPVANVDPELALGFFLNQLIFDVDDVNGVWSSLRGHSLARSMYGWNDAALNNVPFNGTGRLHFPSLGLPDDALIPNYMYFAADGFLRDPERPGTRASLSAARNQFLGGFNAPYTYPDHNNMFLAAVDGNGVLLTPSFHRDWIWGGPMNVSTNPNWNNAVGKYLTLRPRPKEHPSFPFPEDAGGDVKNLIGFPGGNDSIWIDLGAPVMKAPDGRLYKMLFAPLILDLDNRINVNVHGNIRGTGNAHASNQGWGPWEVNLERILTANNGTEAKNLFLGKAIPPLWGRYGPYQKPINITDLLNTSTIPGSVGAHHYGQTDFDAVFNYNGVALGGTLTGLFNPSSGNMPGSPAGTPPNCFPNFPNGFENGAPYFVGGFQMGVPQGQGERTDHSAGYDVFNPPGPVPGSPPPYQGYNRRFATSNMERLLRYGDAGSESLTSEMEQLCPTNLINLRPRCQLTTDSGDRYAAGLSPWLPGTAKATDYQPATFDGPPQSPLPVPSQTVPPASPAPYGGEFQADWRAVVPTWFERDLTTGNPLPDPITGKPLLVSKVDINRLTRVTWNGKSFSVSLPLYPGYDTINPIPKARHDDTTPNNPNADPRYGDFATQFQVAHQARQQLARDIYQAFLAATGVPPVVAVGAPTLDELRPRRWLAQLAVNIVDYIDDDDICTPLLFYPEDGNLSNPALSMASPPYDPAKASANFPAPQNAQAPDYPLYWVFGTELPRVVLSEAVGEFAEQNPGLSIKAGLKTATPPGTSYANGFWIELYNPIPKPDPNKVLQQIDGQDALLVMPDLAGNPNYAPYQIVIAYAPDAATPSFSPTTKDNDNVLGTPPPRPAAPAAVGGQIDYAKTTDQDFINAQKAQISPQGFFVIGPATIANGSIVDDNNYKAGATVMRTDSVAYQSAYLRNYNGLQGDKQASDVPRWPEPAFGATVYLRRLANPHLPFDPNVVAGGVLNPKYNPYLTIDYMDRVSVNQTSVAGNQTLPPNTYTSRVKKQPYTSWFQPNKATLKTYIRQNVPPTNTVPPTPTTFQYLTDPLVAGPVTSQVVDETPGVNVPPLGHSLGMGNNNRDLPACDWLVHLDRSLRNPMELLHVSQYQPHQLTQRFKSLDPNGTVNPQQHAPKTTWFDNSTRLYRAFEYLSVGERSYGNRNPATGLTNPRITGKININTIWDSEILEAIYDANPNNPVNQNAFIKTNLWPMIRDSRSPQLGNGGGLTSADRPFLPPSAGFIAPNPSDAVAPNGRGIEDTLLRPIPGGNKTSARLLDASATVPTNSFAVALPWHDYLRYEMLTKVYDRFTTRSNVFGVWVTVGLFEVTNTATQPVTLGAEIGRSEGRHVRHRMFSVIDRSVLPYNPGPQPTVVPGFLSTPFSPRNNTIPMLPPYPAPPTPPILLPTTPLSGRLVPHFSIID